MVLGQNFKSYSVFKNFRRRVLDTAQKELNKKDKITGFYKSDLGFDFETRRTGRKISHLIFTIKTQQTKPLPQATTETSPTANNRNTPQIILTYEAIGVMQKTVKPYLEQRGEQALQNTLNKFNDDKAKGKITKSEQGYLAYLLRVNAGQETIQDKEHQQKEHQQKEHNKKRLQEQAVEEKILKDVFTKEREAALNSFFTTLADEEQEYIIADFEASELFARHIKSLLVLFDLYNSYGMEDPDIKNYFNHFIIDQYLDKTLNNFIQWKEKNTDAE
jgi:hypothetical protein